MKNAKIRVTSFACLVTLIFGCASPRTTVEEAIKNITVEEAIKNIRDYVEEHGLTFVNENGGRYYGYNHALYQQWHGNTYLNGQETLYVVSWFDENDKRISSDCTVDFYYYLGFYYASQAKQVDVWIIPTFNSYRINENKRTSIDVYVKSSTKWPFSAANPFEPDIKKYERYPNPSDVDQNQGYCFVDCQYDGTDSTESLIQLNGLNERWIKGVHAAYLRLLSIVDSYVSSVWDYEIEDYTGFRIAKHTFESRKNYYSIDACYTLFDR